MAILKDTTINGNLKINNGTIFGNVDGTFKGSIVSNSLTIKTTDTEPIITFKKNDSVYGSVGLSSKSKMTITNGENTYNVFDTRDIIGISNGGTGISTAPKENQILVGNSSGGFIYCSLDSMAVGNAVSACWACQDFCKRDIHTTYAERFNSCPNCVEYANNADSANKLNRSTMELCDTNLFEYVCISCCELTCHCCTYWYGDRWCNWIYLYAVGATVQFKSLKDIYFLPSIKVEGVAMDFCCNSKYCAVCYFNSGSHYNTNYTAWTGWEGGPIHFEGNLESSLLRKGDCFSICGTSKENWNRYVYLGDNCPDSWYICYPHEQTQVSVKTPFDCSKLKMEAIKFSSN